MKKELAVQKNDSVESFISQAIGANVPVETLEKLFALRERVKAEEANAGYIQALANFQGECPIIGKTKSVMNKDGRSVRYQYAPLDAIVAQIQKSLAKNGISYSWDVKKATGVIEAVCTITHVLGHSTTSSFEVPIDSEGFMTAPQKVASAMTFAKRYSLLNGLGISTGDEDTDATDVEGEPEAVSLKSKIVFRLRVLGKKTDVKEVVEADVLDLTKLTLEEKNFPEIISRLQVLIDEKNEDITIS